MNCEAQFVRTRLGSGEKVRAELEVELARERARNHFGLIVTAFAEAGRVQGHWDDNIREKMFGVVSDKLREAVRKPRGERNDAFVFYKKNRADHRVIVISEASRKAEAIGVEAAEAAEKMGRIRHLLRNDGPAAAGTARRRNGAERGKAGVAERHAAGRVQDLCANPAGCGEDYRDDSVPGCSQSRPHCPTRFAILQHSVTECTPSV